MRQALLVLVVVLVILAGVFVAGKILESRKSPQLPTAEPLFVAVFTDSSSVDRTFTRTISPDGHTITFLLSDAAMDGLGDMNLRIRVTNMNTGDPLAQWYFEAGLTYVIALGSPPAPLVNLTTFNTLFDISWSDEMVGAPTISQSGVKAVSRDWQTGVTETIHADLRINPNVAALWEPGVSAEAIRLDVAGIAMNVILSEGT